MFPSYQTLYGALSLIPLFLIWMYLVWCMLLLGAQFAAAFPEWFARRALGGADAEARQMMTALAVLERLYRGGLSGEIATEAELAQIEEVDPQLLPSVLDELLQLRLIVRSQEEGWLLARDPAAVRLYDLLPVFGVNMMPMSGLPTTGPAWAMDVSKALARADETARASLDLTLKELFAREAGGTGASRGGQPAA